MYTQVWDLLVNTKYGEIFSKHYRKRVRFWNNVISCITLFASAWSIANWWIWSQYPAAWSIVLGAAQLVQVFKPLLPLSAKLTALRYYSQDLGDLAIDIGHFWNIQGNYSGNKYANKLSELQKRKAAIDNKWFGDESFPNRKSIEKVSWAECRQYMASYGAITKGEEFDAYNSETGTASPVTQIAP